MSFDIHSAISTVFWQFFKIFFNILLAICPVCPDISQCFKISPCGSDIQQHFKTFSNISRHSATSLGIQHSAKFCNIWQHFKTYSHTSKTFDIFLCSQCLAIKFKNILQDLLAFGEVSQWLTVFPLYSATSLNVTQHMSRFDVLQWISIVQHLA